MMFEAVAHLLTVFGLAAIASVAGLVVIIFKETRVVRRSSPCVRGCETGRCVCHKPKFTVAGALVTGYQPRVVPTDYGHAPVPPSGGSAARAPSTR